MVNQAFEAIFGKPIFTDRQEYERKEIEALEERSD